MVRLEVYNSSGQRVAILINEWLSAGSRDILFDAGSLSSGLYFYQLKAGDFVDSKKFLFIK